MEATKNEKLLYDMWKEAFPGVEFGLDDDFFELGGTSLQALDIISRLGDKYEMDMKTVFETATIRSIASTMRMNPNWAEERLRFIFQRHEMAVQNEEELKEYKERIKKLGLKRNRQQKYQSVLLLGATGFLGAYLLRELLACTNCNVDVIVRAENDEAAGKRIEETWDYYFGAMPDYGERLRCYAGDLTERKFGLTEDTWEEMAKRDEAVLNSAAIVKHMGKTEDFSSINVGIVQSVVEFSKAGIKKDIHQISSIGIIFGKQEDSARTLFTEFEFDVGQELDNNYLQSKFDAEKLLYAGREQGITSEIYRLNGVLFDSVNGTFQKNVNDSSAYLFMRALNTLKIIPDINEYRVDISMVDQIAKGVVKLMLFAQERNQTYHMIHPQSFRFDKLLKKIAGRKNDFRLLDAEEICRYYRENIQNDKVKEAFSQILLNCEIFDSIMKNQYTIRQDMTVKALGKVGFRWKRVRRIHLKRAYRYAKSIDFI